MVSFKIHPWQETKAKRFTDMNRNAGFLQNLKLFLNGLMKQNECIFHHSITQLTFHVCFSAPFNHATCCIHGRKEKRESEREARRNKKTQTAEANKRIMFLYESFNEIRQRSRRRNSFNGNKKRKKLSYKNCAKI